MVDRPILFSALMVQALLAGHKTQTRRALNPQPREWQARVIDITTPFYDDEGGGWGQVETIWDAAITEPQREEWVPLKGLRFSVGDRLWVREAFSGPHWCHGLPPRDWPLDCPLWYWADDEPVEGDWTPPKPGIHMPRWASRVTLIVTDVRVERLQDISEVDARAEGIADAGCLFCGQPEPCGCADASPDAVDAYSHLWDSINGKGAWVENPWCVAVTFLVEHQNIDAVQQAEAA